MELKRRSSMLAVRLFLLLIVPYGIETYVNRIILLNIFLLIVPYGIETPASTKPFTSPSLLIVPYGIET